MITRLWISCWSRASRLRRTTAQKGLVSNPLRKPGLRLVLEVRPSTVPSAGSLSGELSRLQVGAPAKAGGLRLRILAANASSPLRRGGPRRIANLSLFIAQRVHGVDSCRAAG